MKKLPFEKLSDLIRTNSLLTNGQMKSIKGGYGEPNAFTCYCSSSSSNAGYGWSMQYLDFNMITNRCGSSGADCTPVYF